MKNLITSLLALMILTICSMAYGDENLPQPMPSKNIDAATQANEYFTKHLTGNFDITNNYVWRGVSQTANEPAFQGSFTFTFDNHVYLNLWGSNVNFETTQGATATLETDQAIGYSNKVTDNLNFDIHLVRYSYPRASEANYNEVIGSVNYYFLVALMGYSTNVFNTHTNGTYINLGFNFKLPSRIFYYENLSFSGGIGYYDLNSKVANSYHDYNLQIQKAISDTYTIAFQWTGTDGRFKLHPYDDSHIVAMFIANF